MRLSPILFAAWLVSVVCYAQQGSSEHNAIWNQIERMKEQGYQQKFLSEKDQTALRQTTGSEGQPKTVDILPILENGDVVTTTRTSGACIRIDIYRRSGIVKVGFERKWSAERTISGRAFCGPPACRAPVVVAVPPNLIFRTKVRPQFYVAIPQQSSGTDEACDKNLVVDYARKSGKYLQIAERTKPAVCAREDMELGFEDAVQKALPPGAKRLVTISVVPAFRRPSVLVISQLQGRLVGYNVDVQSHVTSSAAPAPSECRNGSGTATELSISDQELDRFIERFHSIDFRSSECVRDQHGKCVHFLDASIYVVTTADGKSIELTEINGNARYRSENPDLLAWVESVVAALKTSEGQPGPQ